MADSRRSSSSSQPSAASLKFGYGNRPIDHAESSGRSEEGRGLSRGELHGTPGPTSQQTRQASRSPSPMVMSQDTAQEPGIRVSKTRKTGGFLLSSTSRHAHSNYVQSHTKASANGKGKEVIPRTGSLRPSSPYNSTRQNGGLRGSPLAHVVISPRPSYGGDSQIPRAATPGSGTTHSETSSPRDGLSGEYTRVGSEFSHEGPYQQQPSGIDPAQIVNMALNLSESRRRNFSAGHILPPSTAGGRRVASGIPVPSPMVQGSYATNGVGGSLRQHLQQQRQISRTHSPNSGRKTPNHRGASTSHPSPPVVESPNAQQSGFDYQYHVSTATLARAEKARQYIELSLEYRRLLQYLPPLKPDASASGNTTYTTSSVPGTANVHLHRTITSNGDERHPLGRRYNPLQLIRNRKLRARTRSPLDPDVEQWNNSSAVKDWVDQVENASQRHGYRKPDKVALPPYVGLDGFALSSLTGSPDPKDLGHRRNEGSVSKPKRPRQDWTFSPSEHLADAYWLEQDNNKVMIENRHGNSIFPKSPSVESLHPRASYESRRSHSKSITASIGSHEKGESDIESHKGSERRRRRPLLGHSRDESRGRLKHAWDKARGRSRSASSGLSSSDDDASARGKRPKIGVVPPGDDESIGPLERQMNKMLDADLEDSPTFSPGTPNKWGTDLSNAPISRTQAHPETEPQEEVKIPTTTEVHDFVPLAVPPTGAVKHTKRPSRILEHPDEPRSSFEDDLSSTNPNSPTARHFVPSIGLELSPPGSRTPSPSRKQKRHILPFIRSDGHRDIRKFDSSGSFQDDSDAKSSRHTSAEAPPTKTSVSLDIAASPNRVKTLFSHKTNESLNNLSPRPSSRGKDGRDGREPESAVRRFLKGGRLGEIVRHEGAKVGGYIRKKDSPQEAVDEFVLTDSESLEESDTEDTDASRPVKDRPYPLRRTASAVADGRDPRKPRYHIDNLPSFRSTHAKASSGPPTPSEQDHISKQQLYLKDLRSPRFERLAPPGLDTSGVNSKVNSDTSSPAISRADIYRTASTSQADDRRLSYGFPTLHRDRSRLGDRRLAAILDKPGGVGRGGLPVTALKDIRGNSSEGHLALADKRHWSISDRPRSRSPYPLVTKSASSVSRADIARVRALLLSSGVKAAEINRRAHTNRYPAPKFLREAAEASHASLRPVPRKEEHVLAARMLTTSLENESAALQDDTKRFRTETVHTLRKDLMEMRDLVQSCVDRASNEGDESLRFGAEITGQRTIEVRRVVDALEKLARARRRRLRWLRRVGFGLGEWAVVVLLWWIWFIVIIFKTIWAVLRGVVRGVRWVFWL